jgi:protein-S-isoprenylcysteine O-methyltransferase Ste14
MSSTDELGGRSANSGSVVDDCVTIYTTEVVVDYINPVPGHKSVYTPHGQMPQAHQSQHQSTQQDAATLVAMGGWLFKRRTMIPVPLALLILLTPGTRSTMGPGWVLGGVGIVAIGEALRLWGVHHIGAVSRTRTDRLGPLIASGPFALVRNPLYLGNVALWIGFALAAGLAWVAPVILILLGFEYHAIVRWEEGLLTARLGEAYRDYMAMVPRWIPRLDRRGRVGRHASAINAFSWRDTFFSERGTLIGIAVGFALIWIKLKTEN